MDNPKKEPAEVDVCLVKPRACTDASPLLQRATLTLDNGAAMAQKMITRLLPTLCRRRVPAFNVFDVMHHGTHEKQLSNVFGWLLDPEGTHRFGDRFQKIFIDAVNCHGPTGEHFEPGPYQVLQEVNTAPSGVSGDIADLVLESNSAVLVVENYWLIG